MKRVFCPLLVIVWLTAGYATAQPPKPEISIQSPKSDMSGIRTFYVACDNEAGSHKEKEKHKLALNAVQKALTDHGMPATSGLLSAMPAGTESKVIIQDRWFGYTDEYLPSLDIKFYDARSGALLASGQDKRTQPAIRRSPEFVANELIEAIFPVASGGKKN
jgi:hypothetical protein